MNFVAIDFETTGLNPHKSRVVEVAAVLFTPSGEILDEFDSLVNPESQIGALAIHGIQDIDLIGAPRFRDLVSQLTSFLHGNVIVAHNAAFDLKFLQHELELAQVDVNGINGLCTLTTLTRLHPTAPRRLAESCSYFGLPVFGSHQAINDARMTAGLTTFLLEGITDLPLPASFNRSLQNIGIEQKMRPLPRREVAVIEEKESFLASLVKRLVPSLVDKEGYEESTCRYVDLLDRILEDRLLTDDEAVALFELATDEGLSQEIVKSIHRTYFLQLLRIANSDHYLSIAERSDLRKVALLLGIDDWQRLVDEAREIEVWQGGIPDRKSRESASSTTDFSSRESTLNFDELGLSQLLSGRSLVITGEFSAFTREQGQEAVIRRGGKATSSISRRTYALVAGEGAGPSKLEKAASLGIPILNLEEFLELLDSGKLPDR